VQRVLHAHVTVVCKGFCRVATRISSGMMLHQDGAPVGCCVWIMYQLCCQKKGSVSAVVQHAGFGRGAMYAFINSWGPVHALLSCAQAGAGTRQLLCMQRR
jgi:hypothetical protein